MTAFRDTKVALNEEGSTVAVPVFADFHVEWMLDEVFQERKRREKTEQDISLKARELSEVLAREL